jgi:hypothetical protein
MLLKNSGSRDRGLQTMSGSGGDYPPKGSKRFPSLFAIIPQAIQETLNLKRSSVSLHDGPFFCREGRAGRNDSGEKHSKPA